MAGSRHPALAGLIAVFLLALSAHAQKPQEPAWPQFRGPNASGIATESVSPPLEFGPSKNLLWKTSLPSGQSSPAIWGNRIFLTAFDAANKKLEVIGLDRSTGQILWRQPIPTDQFEPVHILSTPATATPAVDGERVYVYFGSYGVVAYDLGGALVWEARMPVVKVQFGSGTSPIVAGELVIVNRQEPKEPFLIALDRKTGKTVWKHPHDQEMGPAGYSTPLIVGNQVVIHGGRLEAFDLSTGDLKWWVALNSTGTATPTVNGDTIYVSSWFPFGEADQRTPLPDFSTLLRSDKDGNGTISRDEMPANLTVFSRPDTPDVPGATWSVKSAFGRLDANKDNEIQKEEWDLARTLIDKMFIEHGLVAVKNGGTGDVTGTHVLWRETTAVPEVPSPLVYQNRLYLVRNGGIITCLDASSGKRLFRDRIGAGGPYFASPVAANGNLIIASGDGVVTVLAAGDRLSVLGRNDLGESILASPAPVNGVLYIRTASGLSAFGQK
jgi:outer membrane protein assembly factor BamB